ncbi:50S ribosomal protein L32 [Staphylococcus equorum]|uniref:50S ribosomal protein L32 n=1 Tax=Staphylococcus equorum TaxID=246432 RepID=UPI00398B8429
MYHGSTKRRTSKTRKNKRRTHFKISVPGMTECPSCGEYKLSHRVCKNCGSYNGEDVVSK